MAKNLQDCLKNENVNPLTYFLREGGGVRGKQGNWKEQNIVENMYLWRCIHTLDTLHGNDVNNYEKGVEGNQKRGENVRKFVFSILITN